MLDSRRLEMQSHPLLVGTSYRLESRHDLPRPLIDSMIAGLCQFLELLAKERRELSPPTLIDEAWHEAIIDTRNYERFCTEYFGLMLHHQPPLGPEDNRPETLELTVETVELARVMFGDDLEAMVWRRSKRVQAISSSSTPVG